MIQIDGNPFSFHNFTAERQKQILDYELQIYQCGGTDQEKLDRFINIAGEKLTDQELRNAIRPLARGRQEVVQQDRLPRLRSGRWRRNHIVPWAKGGKTEPGNCRMLCMLGNRAKGGR